jgi:hypothetical protein
MLLLCLEISARLSLGKTNAVEGNRPSKTNLNLPTPSPPPTNIIKQTRSRARLLSSYYRSIIELLASYYPNIYESSSYPRAVYFICTNTMYQRLSTIFIAFIFILFIQNILDGCSSNLSRLFRNTDPLLIRHTLKSENLLSSLRYFHQWKK